MSSATAPLAPEQLTVLAIPLKTSAAIPTCYVMLVIVCNP